MSAAPRCLSLSALLVLLLLAAPLRGQAGAKNIWTIGVLSGPSPFELTAPSGVTNPVFTADRVSDLDVTIVAHPFMVVTDTMFYMFFTAKNDTVSQGGIGLAQSRDGLSWQYRRIVIDEPYDVSYPFVFESGGTYYMLPEAHTETTVRLYRAVNFPDEWVYERDLLHGDNFISPTLVRFQERWWLFTCREGNETCRLFWADSLSGPWTEHPRSPIVAKDLNTARPAGRPFVLDGALYRLGQDCDPTYGNQVHAFRVLEISPTEYREEMIEKPLVKATGQGWNAEAMHHVDFQFLGQGRGLAVVDAQGRP